MTRQLDAFALEPGPASPQRRRRELGEDGSVRPGLSASAQIHSTGERACRFGGARVSARRRRRREGRAAGGAAAEQRARRVLDGSETPTVDELVALIRALNPTADSLTELVRSRRYALKSGLQSVLLTRFPAAVSVQPGGRDPQLILLALGGGAASAGHALLDELSDEARSWAQRKLDEAAAASGPPPKTDERTHPVQRAAPPARLATPTEGPQGDAPSAPELLLAAEETLQAYDYERAEELLRRALAQSPGDPQVAAALLALLVDRLGADAEALELGATALPQVASDPATRVLLATAAARQGRRAAAEEWLGPVSGPAAGEVWATLGLQDVDAGRNDAAARCLRKAEESPSSPGHSSTEQLRRALEQSRHEAVDREAGRLLAELEAGGSSPAAAAAAAAELLRQWPGSATAERLGRAAEQKERAARADETLQAAQAAWAAGAPRRALALATEAAAAGASGTPLQRLLRDAGELVRRLDQERRARRVQERLDSGDPVSAWMAWLRAPDAARVEGATTAGRCEPGWLLELGADGLRGRAQRVAVEGVVALVAARQALSLADPEAALRLLAPHAEVLAPLPEAQETHTQAEQLLAQHRREASSAQLCVALRAQEQEAVGAVRAALDAVHVEALAPEGRRRHAALSAWVDKKRELERLRETVSSCRASGDWFGGRAAAARWAELADPDERAAADRVRTELDRRLRQAWRLARLELPGVPVETSLLGRQRGHSGSASWCSPDGRWLHLPLLSAGWLVVLQVEAGSDRAMSALVVRAPGGLLPDMAVASSGRLQLVGTRGEAIELDPWGPDLTCVTRRPGSTTDPRRAAVAVVERRSAPGAGRGLGLSLLSDVAPHDPPETSGEQPEAVELLTRWLDSPASLGPLSGALPDRSGPDTLTPRGDLQTQLEQTRRWTERIDVGPRQLVALLEQLAVTPRTEGDLYGPAALWCQARSPSTPELAYAAAREHGRRRRWEQARQALEAAPALLQGEQAGSHGVLLHGLACLCCGDVAGAQEAWERAPESAGGGVPGRAELLDVLDVTLSVALGGTSRGGSRWARQVAAAAAAARALADGDPASALRTLEAAQTLGHPAPTPLTLLATAYLALTPTAPEAWLCKLRALAVIVEQAEHDERLDRRPLDVPLFEPGWTAERREQVLDEARAWLEAAMPPGLGEAAS